MDRSRPRVEAIASLRMRRPGGLKWTEYLSGYAFILPALTGITLFGLLPLAYAFYVSFRRYDLLAPTSLYLDDVRRLRGRAHAFAHVTGGGILGNLSRVLPDGLQAAIDWDAWERPPVFEWLARHVEDEELRRVFNLGIGFCAVVPADQADGDLVIGEIR